MLLDLVRGNFVGENDVEVEAPGSFLLVGRSVHEVVQPQLNIREEQVYIRQTTGAFGLRNLSEPSTEK
jgi:hypothetical protein